MSYYQGKYDADDPMKYRGGKYADSIGAFSRYTGRSWYPSTLVHPMNQQSWYAQFRRMVGMKPKKKKAPPARVGRAYWGLMYKARRRKYKKKF